MVHGVYQVFIFLVTEVKEIKIGKTIKLVFPKGPPTSLIKFFLSLIPKKLNTSLSDYIWGNKTITGLGRKAICKPFWKVLSKGVLVGLDAIIRSLDSFIYA